jgi:hypothetical protein
MEMAYWGLTTLAVGVTGITNSSDGSGLNGFSTTSLGGIGVTGQAHHPGTVIFGVNRVYSSSSYQAYISGNHCCKILDASLSGWISGELQPVVYETLRSPWICNARDRHVAG